MKKFKFAALAVLAVVLLALTGCSQIDQSLIGSWGYDLYGTTIELLSFDADGNMGVSGVDNMYKYSADGSTLTYWVDGYQNASVEIEYAITNDQLVLSWSGYEYTLNKLN